MALIRRRGKLYKAIRFYDADFYNKVFGNLKKRFHEKLLFIVRQSRKFTWRVSTKINPYKLRKRKRTFCSLRFLSKQQLKYFFMDIKEYQFRHLYRKIIGYKRGNMRVSFLGSLVRHFEGRLDSFLLKHFLVKPFSLNTSLKDNTFALNDGNSFLKRNYLLNTGDRYSLSTFYGYNFYLKVFFGLLKVRFKKYKGRRTYFFWGRRYRRKKNKLLNEKVLKIKKSELGLFFSFFKPKPFFYFQFKYFLKKRFFFFKIFKRSFFWQNFYRFCQKKFI